MKIKNLFILLYLALLFRCGDSLSPSDEKEFGIYLLKDTALTTSDAKELPLTSLQVQDSPIISMNDVETYNWAEQIITLTPEAFERFGKVGEKVKSTFGLPFVVVVEEIRIYLGNIYPSYSSYLHEDLPSVAVAPFTEMKISRAPDKSLADQRMDERIYQIMKTKNKIKE